MQFGWCKKVLLVTRYGRDPCIHWSISVEGDEGCNGPSGKLLCLCQPPKIIQYHSMLVWLLGRSVCSSPSSTKKLHDWIHVVALPSVPLNHPTFSDCLFDLKGNYKSVFCLCGVQAATVLNPEFHMIPLDPLFLSQSPFIPLESLKLFCNIPCSVTRWLIFLSLFGYLQ